jgi:hypothetical protein
MRQPYRKCAANVQARAYLLHISCWQAGTGDGPTRNLGIVMEGAADAEATAIARKTAQSCAAARTR